MLNRKQTGQSVSYCNMTLATPLPPPWQMLEIGRCAPKSQSLFLKVLGSAACLIWQVRWFPNALLKRHVELETDWPVCFLLQHDAGHPLAPSMANARNPKVCTQKSESFFLKGLGSATHIFFAGSLVSLCPPKASFGIGNRLASLFPIAT